MLSDAMLDMLLTSKSLPSSNQEIPNKPTKAQVDEILLKYERMQESLNQKLYAQVISNYSSLGMRMRLLTRYCCVWGSRF